MKYLRPRFWRWWIERQRTRLGLAIVPYDALLVGWEIEHPTYLELPDGARGLVTRNRITTNFEDPSEGGALGVFQAGELLGRLGILAGYLR